MSSQTHDSRIELQVTWSLVFGIRALLLLLLTEQVFFPPQTASCTNFTPLLSSGAFASWSPHSLQEEASPGQELTASWQFSKGMLPFISRGNCSRPPIWARNIWQRCYILQIFWCFKSNIGSLNGQNLSFKIQLLLYIFCLLMEPTWHRTGWEQNSVFCSWPMRVFAKWRSNGQWA